MNEDNKKKSPGFLFLLIIILFFTAAGINLFIFKDFIFVQAKPAAGAPVPGPMFNQYPDSGISTVLSSVPGKIPILMYHIVLSPYVYTNYIMTGRLKKNRITSRYMISSQDLRDQLEQLYDNNFRNISLDEYLSLMSGKIKDLNRLPPESKLYVITFDDATFGQFDYLGTNSEGKPVIDPDCAVGIMIGFASKHPDFKLNAAFSVPFDKPPFMQSRFVGQKLNTLLDYGFEIVNHTASHKNLARYLPLRKDLASYELGRAMEYFESYLGYRADTINKVAYPDGGQNPSLWDFVKQVQYNGKTYSFTAGLNATGLQAKNPNDQSFNIYNISRIEINSNTFSTFVINAPGLFTTPSLLERASNIAYASVRDSIVTNVSQDFDYLQMP